MTERFVRDGINYTKLELDNDDLETIINALENAEWYYMSASHHMKEHGKEDRADYFLNRAAHMSMKALKIKFLLSDEYNEMVKKSNWIPVTERLPEKQEPVLVYTTTFRDRYDEEISPYVGMAYYTYSPGGGWWGGTDGNVHGAIGIVKVTHWMPLPNPPQEII